MSRRCRGARVGTAAAVPGPFVTAGLRFPLALQQRHRDACSRSPHNMFALISQLPSDSPRCRAGRGAPESPRMEGAGDCGQAGCHEGRAGWKHCWRGQGMHHAPAHSPWLSPGSSRQGDRPGCDRRVSLQPPCTTRSRSWCHTRGEAHPPRTPSPARI